MTRAGTAPDAGLGAIHRAHRLPGTIGDRRRAGAPFGLTEVFDPALARDEPLRAEVVAWLTALDRHGVADTLRGAS